MDSPEHLNDKNDSQDEPKAYSEENGDDSFETDKILEAGQVFVLMSKLFRLSRNARAQW